MDFFVADRKTGKTSALIEWYIKQKVEGNRPMIVVHTHQAQVELVRRLRERGYEPEMNEIVTVYDRHNLHGLSHKTRLAIDNLDLILPVLFDMNIDVVTATGKLLNHYD